jgi:hypothetical protein
VNTLIQKYSFWLFAFIFSTLLLGCALNNSESTSKLNNTTAQVAKSHTSNSLQGTALAFEIDKTEMISGSDPRVYTNGNFKYYFAGDKVFTDAREYNGFAWNSDYKYTLVDNKGEIVQQLKWQENGANVEVNITTQLTYSTPTSGNFQLEVKQTHSLSGLLHYTHAGKFQLIDNKLEMIAKGLPNSSLDFNFQTISANLKALDIKPGSRLSMSFSGPQYGKITLNNKDYETRDYQLIAVDTFNKTIKGTFNDAIPFEIKLHFDQFYFGTFEVNVDSGSFKANGNFMSSRWIPVADYKIQGKFTDGLKYKSKHTNIEYPYSVYLPPNYETSKKKYPVLYLTDGQWVKEFHKAVESHHKDFIVVAIEQGPENRRMEDYKLPGATSYIRFMKEEIIPQIEKQYRTNSNRLFWGASLGCTLGEILLSQETDAKPYFSTYALSDGAYWANTPDIKAQLSRNLAKPKSAPISIFTSGTRQGNYLSNFDFVNRLQSLNNSSLVLKNIEIKETHNEMATPTFEAFIDAMH